MPGRSEPTDFRPGRFPGNKKVVSLVLFVATIAIYWQATGNGFINFDDPGYVTANPNVTTGLTFANLGWAFRATHMGHWHPLTWLSHMADCQCYGLNPLGHHLTSVLLHAASTALLFLLWAEMTGALWCSALLAALFSLHPLHVESVAWVAERKDVLSTFFFFVTLSAYARYVKSPGPARYLLLFGSFFLGLLAKTMLVTLPFVLLLLDYWPLCRISPPFAAAPAPPSREGLRGCRTLRFLLLEKVPLFCLSMASAGITVYAQRTQGAMGANEVFPLGYRVGNALVAYAGYLMKMLWPAGLTPFYPLPQHLSLWQVAGSCLLLTVITACILRLARRFPFLPVGWLWYLGILVPVIGLVQSGDQGMADRYTYVSLIGIFVMVVWGVRELVQRRPVWQKPVAASAGVLLLVLALLTSLQIRHWKNSEELFTHTLRFTSGNCTAHLLLGSDLMAQGRTEEAIAQFQASVRIKPDLFLARLDLANALAKAGRYSEAIPQYRESLRIIPRSELAHYHLGAALVAEGNAAQAVEEYSKAVTINPGFFEAHYKLGLLLAQQGRNAEAIAHFTVAQRLRPDVDEIYTNLKRAYVKEGRL